MTCEDQALVQTNRCTKCRVGFDENDKPVFPRLERRGRYWCCPNCGSSYGENPHSNCPPVSQTHTACPHVKPPANLYDPCQVCGALGPWFENGDCVTSNVRADK